MTDEERVLVARAQGGDRPAFEALVTRHGGRIYSLVLRMLRGDREEAEDVTQEALLRAYEAMPRFRGDSGFYTWLYRIAVNLALHRLERKKLPTRSLDDPEAGVVVPDLSTEPARATVSGELSEAVKAALDRLPDASRTVFLLRESQGLSHDEIADILGIAAGAVRVRLHRAKKELVRLLSPYLEATRP